MAAVVSKNMMINVCLSLQRTILTDLKVDQHHSFSSIEAWTEYPDLKMAVVDATTKPWWCLYSVYFSFVFLQGKGVVLLLCILFEASYTVCTTNRKT